MVHTSLTEDEITLISPEKGEPASAEALSKWCCANRELLSGLVYAKGGVLLRGWELHSVKQAESLVFNAIGMSQMRPYPQAFLDFSLRAKKLGVPAGGITQEKLSRDVPAAQEGIMQTPHQEFGIGVFRPRFVSFFVKVAPPRGTGPTARVYLPDAVQRLSPELRDLLRTHGWWVEQAGVIQPSLLIHPESGAECLQLWCFSRTLAPIAYEAYLQVRASERPDLPFVESIPYDGRPNFPITLVSADGRSKFTLPREQALELFRAVFSTMSLLYWEAGDLFIFDNMLYGHMRMPGPPPRSLHALFGDEVDTRAYAAADAPACVLAAARLKAKGSIELLLEQSGARMWLLRLLLWIPDWLFIWLGRHLWVNAGGYSPQKQSDSHRDCESLSKFIHQQLVPSNCQGSISE
mmetsp:Transcript_53/g.233  ORF Transcript_53/g.233 Transcript_53/m.233 type:complete len:407 (-) Transcript_53:982-2202(-)|eukprot:scaffold280704_cov30-Tisochrysis_lutea.AAC.1